MKKEITIIEISDFTRAKPKKATWYKYYDDIFISAVGEINTPYIRLKTKNVDLKNDNKKCYWHTYWQYEIIEHLYGIAKSGKKTYEVSFKHEGELHIIDSLVNNISIEFQHTLGVDIDEMNQRYKAQFSQGYIPYLVLDFTNLNSYDCLKGIQFPLNQSSELYYISPGNYKELIKKIRKWEKTEYYKHERLFLDFSDRIIRVSPNVSNNFTYYGREEFGIELFNLEKDLVRSKEEFKISEEIRLKAEKERDEILWQTRQENLRQEEKRKKIEYDKEKETGEKYKYLRKCIKDEIILKYIKDYSDNYFEYTPYSNKGSGKIVKSHVYLSENDSFKIIYSTHNNIVKEGGSELLKFSHAIIKLIKTGDEIKTISFKKERSRSTEILGMRIELFEGYLHSFKTAAVFEYKDGKRVNEYYYLFNYKLSKVQWETLSPYFESGYDRDYNKELFDPIVEKIEKKDEWGIIEEFRNEGFVSDVTINSFKMDNDRFL